MNLFLSLCHDDDDHDGHDDHDDHDDDGQDDDDDDDDGHDGVICSFLHLIPIITSDHLCIFIMI